MTHFGNISASVPRSFLVTFAVSVGAATGPALGVTIVQDPQITFLGAIEGNSFRYSFEFALPLGADGIAFELVSHTDMFGNPVSSEFKNVQTPTIDADATVGSNGWAVTGANTNRSIFYAEGSAAVNFSFDVVFHGNLTNTALWRIWFYDNASRAVNQWSVLGGIDYTGSNQGGGSAPNPGGAPAFDPNPPVVVPLPSALGLGLAGLVPLVLLRRRRHEH